MNTPTPATNNVNQYTSRTVPAWFDLFGLVATPSTTVAVNGNATVNVAQNFFHAMVSAANSSQPAFVPVTIVADDGTDPVSIKGNRFVPQSPEAFRYDADGNLLEDGRWLYTWDGENRLIAMQTRPEVIAAGTPGRRLTFSYDYMGRRVSKEVHAWHHCRDLRVRPLRQPAAARGCVCIDQPIPLLHQIH